MPTSKYIRPMSLGELLVATLKIYVRTFWPLWILYILLVAEVERFHWWLLNNNSPTAIIVDKTWSLVSIFLPTFLIGPAMLIIFNIVLERPKKSWSSFRKGMAPGEILRVFIYFSLL